MAGSQYRIKLYGHTSKDLRAFLKHLASILGTDEDGARQILLEVPVVIKEGISRDKARSLQEALTLIQALCLIEPMPGEKPEREGTDSAAIGQLLESVRSDLSTDKRTWTSKIWWPVGLGVATVLLVWGALAIMSSHRSTVPHRPRVSVSRDSVGTPAHQDPSREYERYSRDELITLMEQLQDEAQELRVNLKAEEKALVALYNQAAPDREALRMKKRDLVSLRNQLARAMREIRFVERRIATLNRAQQ